MRARISGFAAVLLLGACTEQGVAPRPGGWTDTPVETPVGPVAPTDPVDESESAQPPAAEIPVEGEPPAVVPLSGSAEVAAQGTGSGVSDVEQVDVDLTVRGVHDKGTVEVEFISPAGHPYERRSAVIQAVAPDVAKTVRFSLPVAGTTVATSAMSGTWQVRFFFDGAPLTTASFTLEQ
ncbi:hypothetical protein LZ198_10880 [Myxococcus sp. K15C18031901]|uniref:hypothetical protein n=1 Tax=Myxococcus dinghuensis TaxID=2906761 RepID=UPI0020A79A03|nr:hypothetical protein [Myxococcus dinghuensis]MCP3099373.1 hypothetical protein [Myxococcus dinghuensis]